MKSSIIIASLALCAIPAKSDTIRVETVQAVPPVCVSMPYMTDSTTMDGKAFDVRQTLDNNASLALNRRLCLPEGRSSCSDRSAFRLHRRPLC